jgi:DNA repair photolyase
MHIEQREAASILTPQRQGFLASGPYPFTHALSGYLGCAFGQTTCGLYCYAQFLPNWQFGNASHAWGEAVTVKSNAPELLEKTLGRMKPEQRQRLRIFMSSTTDPYQPLEHKHEITRRCLEVFARYQDLDALVVQTRSPLAIRDLSLLQNIPYTWLSVTIETDDQNYLQRLKGGPPLAKRWDLVRQAHKQGIHTQITVSPCLPYSSIETFGQHLLNSGAERIVIDTMVEGDGSHGRRTARSPFAQAEPTWNNTDSARHLYDYLYQQAQDSGVSFGWSTAGFCGIPPRYEASWHGKGLTACPTSPSRLAIS